MTSLPAGSTGTRGPLELRVFKGEGASYSLRFGFSVSDLSPTKGTTSAAP
jgi:hypothetical protein